MSLTEVLIKRPLLICFGFAILSTVATLQNTYIFRNGMMQSNPLLLVQNIVSLVVLTLLRRLKVVEFSVTLSSPGDWVVGVLYSLNVVCGLWSLLLTNVVMFGVLKRCTTVITWFAEFYLRRTPTTIACLPPIVLMLLGTVVASHHDSTATLAGYLLAGASCVFQGCSFEASRIVARRNKGVCAVLYSNCVVSLVILGPLILATGGASDFAWSKIGHSNTIFHITLNALICLLMNYFIFLNCFVNSPLAHTVTGNMKILATTVLGAVMYGAPIGGAVGLLGLVCTFGGGFWFSYVKLMGPAKGMMGCPPLGDIVDGKWRLGGDGKGESRLGMMFHRVWGALVGGPSSSAHHHHHHGARKTHTV